MSSSTEGKGEQAFFLLDPEVDWENVKFIAARLPVFKIVFGDHVQKRRKSTLYKKQTVGLYDSPPSSHATSDGKSKSSIVSPQMQRSSSPVRIRSPGWQLFQDDPTSSGGEGGEKLGIEPSGSSMINLLNSAGGLLDDEEGISYFIKEEAATGDGDFTDPDDRDVTWYDVFGDVKHEYIAEWEFVRYKYQERWQGPVSCLIFTLVTLTNLQDIHSSGHVEMVIITIFIIVTLAICYAMAYFHHSRTSPRISLRRINAQVFEGLHVLMSIFNAGATVLYYATKETCGGKSSFEREQTCMNAFMRDALVPALCALTLVLYEFRIVLSAPCVALINLCYFLGFFRLSGGVEPLSMLFSRMILHVITSTFLCIFQYRREAVLRDEFRSVVHQEQVQRSAARVRDSTQRVITSSYPVSVARRVVDGILVVDKADSATVVCASLPGFTKYCSTHGGTQIADLVERTFVRLDLLAAAHGLVKTQCLGDTYVAASGLLESDRKHHVERAFMFATIALKTEITPDKSKHYDFQNTQQRIGWRLCLASGALVGTTVGSTQSYVISGPALSECMNLLRESETCGVFISVDLQQQAFDWKRKRVLARKSSHMSSKSDKSASAIVIAFDLEPDASVDGIMWDEKNSSGSKSDIPSGRRLSRVDSRGVAKMLQLHKHDSVGSILSRSTSPHSDLQGTPGKDSIDPVLSSNEVVVSSASDLDEEIPHVEKLMPGMKKSACIVWRFENDAVEEDYKRHIEHRQRYGSQKARELGFQFMFLAASALVVVLLLNDFSSGFVMSLLGCDALVSLIGIMTSKGSHTLSLFLLVTFLVLFNAALFSAPYPSIFVSSLMYWYILCLVAVWLWYSHQNHPMTHLCLQVVLVHIPLLVLGFLRHGDRQDVFMNELVLSISCIVVMAGASLRFDARFRFTFALSYAVDQIASRARQVDEELKAVVSRIHPAWVAYMAVDIVKAGGSSVLMRKRPEPSDISFIVISVCPGDTPIDDIAELRRRHELIDKIIGRHERLFRGKSTGTHVVVLANVGNDYPTIYLAFAIELMKTACECHIDFSCVISHGPVLATVIGDARISFELFGDAIQTAFLLLEAAPPNMLFATNPFQLEVRDWNLVAPDKIHGMDSAPVVWGIRGRGRIPVHTITL